jgi:uncharacterized protein (TIGR02246 family)
MNTRLVLSAAVAVAAAAALAVAARQQPPTVNSAGGAAPNAADHDAILKSASDFAAAFNRRDAEGVAALFTENAEARDPDGRTFTGRGAIAKAYADFFQPNAGLTIEVLVKSVRFPAKDLAVEEGLLRQSHGPKDLPATTAYVAVHVREGGRWLVALSCERGGQDRLEDLYWLLGEWTTRVKDADVKLSFVRDPKKPVITGTFTRTPSGKDSVSGTIRITFDPVTGQLRSWGFEDDGAHSQALWVCDGKSGVLDSRGVLADGTPTVVRIVFQRVAPDAITWRAIDRVVGNAALPDTPPIRLTRGNPK